MAWYWQLLWMLRLFGGLAIWVHCQSTSDLYIYQTFEADAVHSIMRSWVDAGTNASALTDMGWSFQDHPCKFTNSYDDAFMCDIRQVQLGNGSVLYYWTVTALVLYGIPNGGLLVGGLPEAILNLTNLIFIDIHDYPTLSGPLPPDLFCYSNVLKQLSLVNCSFNGSISDHRICGSNVYLEFLDLSCNSLTAFNLEYFNFDSLTTLNVSNNQLNGEFSIGGPLIQYIDLSNNYCTNISFASYDFQYGSFKAIYAQNNSISRFPIEAFLSDTLQDIYLDHNDISNISIDFDSNVSSLQRISMSNNALTTFPEKLLQLPYLNELILDSNMISGPLYLPNISFSTSSIKSISLLYNNITDLHPSDVSTSRLSAFSLQASEILFLGGNPICKNSHKNELLRQVCRYNSSSPLEDLNFNGKPNKIVLPIIICVCTIVFLALITTFFVIQKLRKKITLLQEIQKEFDKRDLKPNLYSFTELKVATQEFHVSNELGHGGFGVVYKGVLPNGNNIAVKKLTKLDAKQGIQDFLSEIIAISNIKHRNLVQLKGCCIKENQRILVYEYMENKNLADRLWGDFNKDQHLDWPTRFNIILGISRGLTYLHEDVQPPIIHRDIKGPNILLDKDLNPKIADFGLALFFPSLNDGETHMSVSKVAGTMGYMSPEYASYGQVSTKLDVFSFGVLLLEIVSGRKNIDLKLPTAQQYLVQWAQKMDTNDDLSELIDKSLQGMTNEEIASLKQVVEIGLQCLHNVPTRRPTMSEVVAMLVGNRKVNRIAFEENYHRSNNVSNIGSSSYSFTMTNPSQCVIEEHDDLQLKGDNYEQSLQLSETTLLSKLKLPKIKSSKDIVKSK